MVGGIHLFGGGSSLHGDQGDSRQDSVVFLCSNCELYLHILCNILNFAVLTCAFSLSSVNFLSDQWCVHDCELL